MALDDKDKKFIKDTVENSVNSGMEKQQKKTETAMKRENLSRSIEERKQREKYIEELKKVQDDGQATMAQKFELFKEQISKDISQDLKDTIQSSAKTMRAGTQLMGTGAGKLAGGMDGLLTRIFSVDPFLAALYAGTKGVTKELWNVTSGAAQMVGGATQVGFGALKGVGGAAAGLLNNAANNIITKVKESKQEKEEEEGNKKEEQTRKNVPVLTTQAEQDVRDLEVPSMFESEGESNAEQIAKLSEDMEKKINEVHEIVTKEQKGQAKELSKGFSGIQKTMDAIKVVTDAMKAKQIMIATGVVLGAVAIIALYKWFASGGFANLLNGIKQNVLGADDDTPTPTNMPLDASGFDITTLNSGDYNNFLDKKKDAFTGINKQSEIKKVMGTKVGGKPTVKQHYMEFDVGELTPIVAPFDGICTDLKMKTQEDGRLTWVMTIQAMHALGAGHTMGDKFEKFQLDGVTNPQVTENGQFSKGEIIAYATKTFKVSSKYEKGLKEHFSNYQSYVNQQKDNNWKDVIYTTKNAQTEQKRQLVQDDVWKAIRKKYGEKEGKSFWEKRKEAAKSVADSHVDAGLREYTKGSERTHDNPDKSGGTNSPEDVEYGEAPNTGTGKPETKGKGTPNVTSENEKKTQQQNTQLKQETQPKPNKVSDAGTNGDNRVASANINIQAPDINVKDTYSDTLTIIQLDRAIPNGYGMDC